MPTRPEKEKAHGLTILSRTYYPKPAQADAWYAEPDYEGDVLYRDLFVTRAEAEAWAAAQAEQEAAEHEEQ